jgi:hypothetical protein
MTDTTTTVTAPAAEAHRKAFVIHAAATVALAKAKTELDASVSERTAMIESVVSGSNVNSADLRENEERTKDRERDWILATQIEAGALARLHEKEAAAIHETSAALDVAVHAGAARVLKVSQECDDDLLALRERLAGRADALGDLLRAIEQSRHHNVHVAERGKTNQTMKSQHESRWGRAQTGGIVQVVSKSTGAHFTESVVGQIGNVQAAISTTLVGQAWSKYPELMRAVTPAKAA